jgi:hypothetical protein
MPDVGPTKPRDIARAGYQALPRLGHAVVTTRNEVRRGQRRGEPVRTRVTRGREVNNPTAKAGGLQVKDAMHLAPQ